MEDDFLNAALREARLARLEPPLKDGVKALREIANGFERSQAFYAAMEMGLFAFLARPAGVAEICEKTGILERYAAGYLDLLVSLGTLEKSGGVYATSADLAPFLVEASPYYARYLLYSMYRRQTWANLADTLRGGSSLSPDACGYKTKIDARGIDYMAYNAMLGRLQYTVSLVASLEEFRGARRLIDLGGGHGLLAIAFAQENDRLEAHVFDRPEVAAHAEKYIARSGLANRVKAVGGDYVTDDFGSGYDVVLDICSLEGSDAKSRAFYGKVAKALSPGGLFVKTTFTLDDDRRGPALTLMFDLEERLLGNDHVHLSNGELIDMMRELGLVLLNYRDMAEAIDIPMRTFIFKKTERQQ